MRRMRKGPLFAIVSYAASPKGRRQIQQLRRRLDTPENRRKAIEMKDRAAAAARQRRKR
jgi:hypothetical protein